MDVLTDVSDYFFVFEGDYIFIIYKYRVCFAMRLLEIVIQIEVLRNVKAVILLEIGDYSKPVIADTLKLSRMALY